MKKKFVSMLCVAALAVGLTGCGGGNDNAASTSAASASGENLQEVTLILDYTPNTNHTGIYVAQEEGYFADEGLAVNIIEPGDNNTSAASLLPARGIRRQLSGRCDLRPHWRRTQCRSRPIATVIQHNTSGFAALKDSASKGQRILKENLRWLAIPKRTGRYRCSDDRCWC